MWVEGAETMVSVSAVNHESKFVSPLQCCSSMMSVMPQKCSIGQVDVNYPWQPRPCILQVEVLASLSIDCFMWSNKFSYRKLGTQWVQVLALYHLLCMHGLSAVWKIKALGIESWLLRLIQHKVKHCKGDKFWLWFTYDTDPLFQLPVWAHQHHTVSLEYACCHEQDENQDIGRNAGKMKTEQIVMVIKDSHYLIKTKVKFILAFKSSLHIGSHSNLVLGD